MLIFTREKGEPFHISDDVNTKDGRCKLIVHAPNRIKVLREDVAALDAIEARIDA